MSKKVYRLLIMVFLMAAALAPAGSPAAAADPAGLVSRWSAEGNANDSADGNNGTLMNGATFAPGNVGQAFVLDGINDYVQIGPKANLVMANAVTLSIWIYPTGPGSHRSSGGIIFNKEGEYEITRAPDGTILWAFANTNPGWYWHNTGYRAPLNTWTHIAVTYDNGLIKTYGNGALVETYHGSGSIGDAVPTHNDAWIGGRQSFSQYFQGRLDEVAIYNRALTLAEIQGAYEASPPTIGAVVLNNAYQQVGSLSSGLVSAWSAENSALDSLGANNGAAQGSVAYAPGRVGQAFSFNGNNTNYVSVADAASLRPAQLTLEAWVYPTTADTYRTIVTKEPLGSSTEVGYGFRQRRGDRFMFTIGREGFSYASAQSTTAFQVNTWYHLIGTYDGATAKLYVDGKLEATGPGAATTINSTYPLVIGRLNSSGDPFAGMVDQVKVFNRVLSSTEVGQEYGAWLNQLVTVHYTCADSGSGVASCPADVSVGEGTNQTFVGTATDTAGNSNRIGVGPINIDRTSPTIDITGVADGNSYTLGGAPAPGYTLSDNLSGIDTQSAVLAEPTTASGAGTYEYAVTATDKAGNSRTVSATYRVVYAFGGFLQPIAAPGQTFKAGSAIPVKFQLRDAAGAIVPNAVARLTANGRDATTQGGANAGNQFRYDATGQLYIYNLSTRGMPPGPLTLVAMFDDGTTQSIVVTLK